MDYKKWLGLAVVIILIIIAVFLLIRIPVSGPGAKPTSTPINKIENFPATEAPREFPTQLPIENGAKIISNYNATSPDGRLQATRVFLSSKSVQTNFDFYRNYLTKNNWKLLGESNDTAKPDQKALFAQNSSGVLNISIYKATSGSTVDLSFLPLK